MKINFDYLENSIELDNNSINVIEIENKKYFYKIVNDFIKIKNGIALDEIKTFKNNLEEVDLNNKIDIIIDFFNLNYNDKKLINNVEKSILEKVTVLEKENLNKQYKKIVNILRELANDLDLPINISDEMQLEKLIKILRITLEENNELLDKLLLLIDLNKTIYNNEIIIFINLKQFLSKNELIELYKYSLYNETKIIMIDSQCYEEVIKYEKKLIIDNDLEEFMIQ